MTGGIAGAFECVRHVRGDRQYSLLRGAHMLSMSLQFDSFHHSSDHLDLFARRQLKGDEPMG